MKNVPITYQLFLVLFFQTGVHFIALAQPENKFIRRGNNAFKDGDYKAAEIDYRKALEKKIKSTKGTYNLGDAIYQQAAFEDAASIFGSLAESDIPAENKAKAFHNLGNSLMQMQKFDAAIESYKNALRNDPNDLDTKYNLEYAKKMLQQQQQDQQNQDKQDQDREAKEQEQKQDQEQKRDQKDKQEQKDQEQKQDKKQDQQQQPNEQQQQQQQTKQISQEDAERMLQALKDNERKTLEKLKLEKFKSTQRVKSEKDW